MTRRKKNFPGRRLHCETLEQRFLLANAPFQPVLDLQVDTEVVFDATSGAVSAWNDQATNANHLRSGGAEQPTFGAVQTPTGLDAISFDGVDDRLLRDVNDAGGITGPPVNDKSRTMFLVAQFHDASTFGGASYGRGALNQGFSLGVGGPATQQGNLGVQVWPDNSDFYTSSQGFASPGNSTGWMVLSVVHERDGFDPAANNWFYRDGVEIASWDHKFNTKLHSSLDLNGNTASRLVLGEGIKERGHVEMDVAAWLVYDEALSNADRSAVEGFLTATYLNGGSNADPAAVDDDVAIADGSTVVIDVLNNDTDSDGFLVPGSVTIVTPPSQATSFSVDPATGAVSYTHNGSGLNDSLTYTVEDNLGATSNVATVSITVSSDLLPVTAGLVTLLESDSGVTLGAGSQVDAWLDGSTSGLEIFAAGDPQLVNNATPSGQAAIVFDGAGDKLEIVGNSVIKDLPANAEDRTVFVVANYLDDQGVQAGFAYGKANANRTFAVGADGGTGNLAVQGYLGSNDLVSTTAGVGAGWQLQSVVLENNNLQHFESGALIDSWTHSYQTRVDAPASKLVLGQSLDGAGYSQLEVGAVLVYDRALSASERQQVENYLATKYTNGDLGDQPPTAVDDSYSTSVGGVIDTGLDGLPGVLANDSDPNLDPLDAILVDGPSHGTLSLNLDGSFVYTHTGADGTDDSFTYRANDGALDSNLATVELTIASLNNNNSQIVRWHGDYYQHLFDNTWPQGSAPEVRENRSLRGGPPAGAQHSVQGLDLDNDGQFDDSRVFYDFSLETPLNPLDTTSKPDGIIYHTELPSAKFYGGMSANFYNYETNRIQQAFIENDGAGGELDDVGYPSPYLTPEFQGLSDFVESVRHSDGRPQKNHNGPQDDFAINIYRPDKPHPLDAQDDPADNLSTFSAAYIWRKDDFLAGGDSAVVSLDSDSSFSFQSTRWWENIGAVRWILQSQSGQLYISQFSVAGAQDFWGTTNEFPDPLNSDWAEYNPEVDQLDFEQETAVWIDPVANNLFNDIQAVGLYVENDTPSGELTKFSLDEIRFNAVVSSPLAASSASTLEATPASFSLALSLANDIGSSQDDVELVAALPASEQFPTSAVVESVPRIAAESTANETDRSASEDGESIVAELQSLDEAFATWSQNA